MGGIFSWLDDRNASIGLTRGPGDLPVPPDRDGPSVRRLQSEEVGLAAGGGQHGSALCALSLSALARDRSLGPSDSPEARIACRICCSIPRVCPVM